MEGPEANLELIGVGEGNCNHSSSKNNTKERNYAWSPRSRPGHSRQLLGPDSSSSPMNPHYLRGNSVWEKELPQILILQLLRGLSQKAKIKTQIYVPSGFLPLIFFLKAFGVTIWKIRPVTQLSDTASARHVQGPSLKRKGKTITRGHSGTGR